jgi:hypothetical protein
MAVHARPADPRASLVFLLQSRDPYTNRGRGFSLREVAMVSFRLSPTDVNMVRTSVREAQFWLKTSGIHSASVYLILNCNCNICMCPTLRGTRERDALLLGSIDYDRRKRFYRFVPECLETRSNTALSRAIWDSMAVINKEAADEREAVARRNGQS